MEIFSYFLMFLSQVTLKKHFISVSSCEIARNIASLSLLKSREIPQDNCFIIKHIDNEAVLFQKSWRRSLICHFSPRHTNLSQCCNVLNNIVVYLSRNFVVPLLYPTFCFRLFYCRKDRSCSP